MTRKTPVPASGKSAGQGVEKRKQEGRYGRFDGTQAFLKTSSRTAPKNSQYFRKNNSTDCFF